jgi:hypothetical protein
MAEITGLNRSMVYTLYSKAKKRGLLKWIKILFEN